jgi:hypothetical protein
MGFDIFRIVVLHFRIQKPVGLTGL